jgi:Domain of unknown function (DU1801)
MNVLKEIESYISCQAESKQADLRVLHELVQQIRPGTKLWFTDGTDNTGKVVANPNIGYGSYTIKYANGTTKEFFRIGLSGNKTGISVYIMGIADKSFLANTFAKTLGKATVTGYCIRFKTIKDINLDVLQAAIRYGFELDSE